MLPLSRRRFALMAGTAGVMTGFAFPEVLVKVFTLHLAGKIDEAADLFYRFVPLMRFEFQEGVGMAIRKEMYRRRGAIAWPVLGRHRRVRRFVTG